MKKEMVIFVPGIKYIPSRRLWIENLAVTFLKVFNIMDPVEKNYIPIWIKALKKNNRDVLWLHWNGGLTPISKWMAVRRLQKLISHYKQTHDISLIGISFGGELALEAFPRFDGHRKSVVLLCSTSEKRKINSETKIFNIYSPDDIMEKVSTKLLAPLSGGILLEGKNTKNISIPGMRHENFCLNDVIPSGQYEGKRISYIVNRLFG